MTGLHCFSMLVLAVSAVASQAGTVVNVYASDETCSGRTVKHSTADPIVAFSVARKAGFSPAKTSIIPMDHVFYNDGGYFDMKRSVFTAPVSGLYAFYFGACGEPGKQVHILLYVKNKDTSVNIATTYNYNTGSFNQASGSMYTKLKQGEEVTLWCSGRHAMQAHIPPSLYLNGQLIKQLP